MAEPATQERIDPNWPPEVESRLGRIGSAELDVVIVLGEARMTIEEVLNVKIGDLIETDKLTGTPVEVLANGRLFCYGEVVVVGDNLAIRINGFPKS